MFLGISLAFSGAIVYVAIVGLSVSPRVGIGPQTVAITVRVSPPESARRLVVAAVGFVNERSTVIQMEGERSARAHRIQWELQPDDYVIRAEVQDEGGRVLGAAESTVTLK